MGWANQVLRFLLEIALLTSLAYWGFSEQSGALQWVIGLGAPLVVAVVWGRFIAPKASHPPRLLLELAVFAAGVAALFAADQTVLALVFAALVVVHLSLTFVLDQRPR